MHQPSVLKSTFKKDGVHLEARCYPPASFNWSLGSLYSQEDTAAQEELCEAISRIALEFGTRRIFAPSVAYHSGVVVDQRQLNVRIQLPYNVALYRNKLVKADAVEIRPRQAFMMSGAGCPVCTVAGMGVVAVGHASRDALIDRKRIETGTPDRRPEMEGVFDAMVARLKAQQVPIRKMRARTSFHINPLEFSHSPNDPKYKDFNAKLGEDILDNFGTDIMTGTEGYLDLSKLIERRARHLGLASFEPGAALPEGYAHTRREGALATERNLIFVARIS